MIIPVIAGICLGTGLVMINDKSVQKMFNVDGYLIRNPKDTESAKRLAFLSSLTLKLFSAIRASRIHMKHPGCVTLLERFKCPNKKCNIQEKSYKHDSLAAYTVDKKLIGMCMKHKDKHEDKNTMIFVYIHELAHVMSTAIDHGDEFWNNFEYLLNIADQAELYTYQPFHENNGSYCGHSIKYTPYIKY
jgi:hypothetical protein